MKSTIAKEQPKEQKAGALSLLSLMNCNLEYVLFVHAEYDRIYPAIMRLNRNTLTAEGKQEWSDILAATVKGIKEGLKGTEIALSACDPQRLGSFVDVLNRNCPRKDYSRWIQSACREEAAYKNGRAAALIATYEEVYNVPHGKKITQYFGDHISPYFKSHIPDEQIETTYNEALNAIHMDSDAFQEMDDFIYRGEIVKRMRACALEKGLLMDEYVYFIPSKPLIGAQGFRIGGGWLDEINPESLTCTVVGEEIGGSMELPLYNVLARPDPAVREKHFGLRHIQPLYGADDAYVRDVLAQAEKKWEESASQEEGPSLTM